MAVAVEAGGERGGGSAGVDDGEIQIVRVRVGLVVALWA